MPYDREYAHEASLTPPAQTHYDAPRCQNTSMGQQCDLEAGHDGVHWHRDGANINVWYTDPEQWERMVKLPTPKWRPDDSGYIVEISQSPTISGVMWFWEVGTPRGSAIEDGTVPAQVVAQRLRIHPLGRQTSGHARHQTPRDA